MVTPPTFVPSVSSSRTFKIILFFFFPPATRKMNCFSDLFHWTQPASPKSLRSVFFHALPNQPAQLAHCEPSFGLKRLIRFSPSRPNPLGTSSFFFIVPHAPGPPTQSPGLRSPPGLRPFCPIASQLPFSLPECLPPSAFILLLDVYDPVVGHHPPGFR